MSHGSRVLLVAFSSLSNGYCIFKCHEYPFQDKKNEDEEKKKKVKHSILKLILVGIVFLKL